MGHGHPELVSLELLPLEPVPDGVEPSPSARAQLVEREPPRWVRGLLHILTRAYSWLDIGRRPEQRGTELAVRRRIHADIDVALPAVIAAMPAVQARLPEPFLALRRPARLEPRLVDAHTENGVLRIPARLRGPWLPRPVPVEIDVEPWSTGQSELRLQTRRRRGAARPSPRYFDAAHDVLDVLRATAEARIVQGVDPPAAGSGAG